MSDELEPGCIELPSEYRMPDSERTRVSLPALRDAAEGYRRKGWDNLKLGPDVVVWLVDQVAELAECRAERDRLREALQAGHDVAASAMDAVTAFVHGNGPRGMELVPLISKAHHAANLYQAALDPLVSGGETDGR